MRGGGVGGDDMGVAGFVVVMYFVGSEGCKSGEGKDWEGMSLCSFDDGMGCGVVDGSFGMMRMDGVRLLLGR